MKVLPIIRLLLLAIAIIPPIETRSAPNNANNEASFNVIQWNCQGYFAKYTSIRRILYLKFPVAAILQETMIGNQIPNGYNLYCYFNNPTPGNGLATLIRNDVPHTRLNIRTQLIATAFKVGIKKQYTLCNVYLPPQKIVHLQDISNLIDNCLLL